MDECVYFDRKNDVHNITIVHLPLTINTLCRTVMYHLRVKSCQQLNEISCNNFQSYECRSMFWQGILPESEKRQPFWKSEIISEIKGNYIVGKRNGAKGDSGSPIFDANGHLLGMTIAKQDFS
ncbi:unnamed protein product [Caenorhabditis angaria]|uniref:Serine protease n=1 Tax=Caenorhabditis angaria TaxID=860376 RepID=A0A9P1IYL0_9PELO|nr:unnamed protein product [Caenorhabditis angaria]